MIENRKILLLRLCFIAFQDLHPLLQHSLIAPELEVLFLTVDEPFRLPPLSRCYCLCSAVNETVLQQLR